MICTVPLPPGAMPETFRVAPAPAVCSWCDGAGVEPDIEAAEVKCQCCGGFGWEPTLVFSIGESRSCEVRDVKYTATAQRAGVLKITTAKKATHTPKTDVYAIAEQPADGPARGFACLKVGPGEPVRHIELTERFVWCDCEGRTYQSAAKANQRAHELKQETFPTFGCKHADALASLLAGGWFDLPG